MSIDKKEVLSNALPKKLLSRQEAAELLGVSSGTLAVWLCSKRYNLPYIKVGRLVKYLLKIIKMVIIVDKNYHNMIEFAKEEVFWTAIASICAVIGIVRAYFQNRRKNQDNIELKIVAYENTTCDNTPIFHDCELLDIVFEIINNARYAYILHEIEILYCPLYLHGKPKSIKIIPNSQKEYFATLNVIADYTEKELYGEMPDKTIGIKTNRGNFVFKIDKFNENALKSILKMKQNQSNTSVWIKPSKQYKKYKPT